MSPTRAVFFDVDFTLIYPGPTFQAEGYRAFGAKHGLRLDPSAFDSAVAQASIVLDAAQEHAYDPAIFVTYTSRVIEAMGGRGPGVAACAREMYDEWALCRHFHLYEEVPEVLAALAAAGLRLGLISNSHRCLASFQSHFELDGLISAAISSSEHGFMKPHPSIFRAGLEIVGVEAHEAMMVGDSLAQDIEGARRLGMRGVLVVRSGHFGVPAEDVSVIRSLRELAALL
jgi:HAD superfamily hydrolase (TIGR01549 family)